MGRANVRQPWRIGPDQSLTAGWPEPNDVQAESRLTAWSGPNLHLTRNDARSGRVQARSSRGKAAIRTITSQFREGADAPEKDPYVRSS